MSLSIPNQDAAAHSSTAVGASQSIRIVDDFNRYQSALAHLGGVYHARAWKDALDVYQLRTHWLVAEWEGQAVAVLPLARQSSRLFGQRLISLPWVDEAGAIGESTAVQKLLQHAAELARGFGTRCELIVKQPLHGPEPERPNGWATIGQDKVLMRRELGMTSEALWSKLSAKVRNQVRKAEKSGLITEVGGGEFLPDFHRIYARNMRDLGSPAHSLAFFQALSNGLGDRCRLYRTHLNQKAVGAGFVILNGPSLDIPWAASIREFNELCVNHGMYWKILSDACDAQFKLFHFGRSTVESGQHKFKKQWGAEEQPLRWHALNASVERDSGDKAPLKEQFGTAQKIWKKLPLWAANRLGPLIVRHAP